MQLGNYLRSIQEEDIRQGRKHFSLTIPMLLTQHSPQEQALQPLSTYYGPLPSALAEYIPAFSVVEVNVQTLSDEFIENLQHHLWLRNVPLVLKHARNAHYMRQHFSRVLIFASQAGAPELSRLMFRATFLYVQQMASFTKEEMMDLIQTLPPPY
ncbi:MAG: hypothetical protein RMJ33_14880, partial [Saprospiraceae bacterium]|nr:hypothetical protein [Saprospiraceae bacterium]